MERYWRRGVRSVEEMASLFGAAGARTWLRMEALELVELEDSGSDGFGKGATAQLIRSVIPSQTRGDHFV